MDSARTGGSPPVRGRYPFEPLGIRAAGLLLRLAIDVTRGYDTELRSKAAGVDHNANAVLVGLKLQR